MRKMLFLLSNFFAADVLPHSAREQPIPTAECLPSSEKLRRVVIALLGAFNPSAHGVTRLAHKVTPGRSLLSVACCHQELHAGH